MGQSKKKITINMEFTFWLDEAEPEVHPQQYSNLKFYAGNGAQSAMLYPYYYSKMFYEGLKSEGETDIILLTRAAYPERRNLALLYGMGILCQRLKHFV